MSGARPVAIVTIVLFLLITIWMAVSTGIPGEQALGPTLEGPCEGTATVSGGGPTLDPSTSGGVYTVPITGTAEYTGTVNGPSPGPERPEAHGQVVIPTPPLFPNIPVGGSWPGEGDVITGVSDTGNEGWDLPDWTPRGVVFQVSGFHDDAGGIHCEGVVWLKFEGSATESVMVWIPVVLVVVLIILLVVALAGAGKPILGGIVGLLLGLFVGITLIAFGRQPLQSPAPVILMVVGLVLGVAGGIAGFGSPDGGGGPAAPPEGFDDAAMQ